jgi:hypothetical protein
LNYNHPPRCQIVVGQAFQPDTKPGKVRLESLTYLMFWRVVVELRVRVLFHGWSLWAFMPIARLRRATAMNGRVPATEKNRNRIRKRRSLSGGQ